MSNNHKFSLFAVLLEAASLYFLLYEGGEYLALPAYFALHSAASLITGVVMSRHMMDLYPDTKKSGFAYFTTISFLLPVLGIVGLALFLKIRGGIPVKLPVSEFGIVENIKFFTAPASSGSQFSRSGVRPILGGGDAPQGLKLKALLALQDIPTRAANNLIREQLGESADDVRLLAYGLLDAREKALDARIHEAKSRIGTANDDERAALSRQLAELYWELVYRGIAQGSLLQHAIREALRFSKEALALDATDAGAWALHGRLLLLEGDCAAAEKSFTEAMKLGLGESRVSPYLAELAFVARDYPRVRQIMKTMNHQSVDALSAISRFWNADERPARN